MKKTIFFTLALLLLPEFGAVGSDLADELKDCHERQFLKELLRKRVGRTVEFYQTMDKSLSRVAKLQIDNMTTLADFIFELSGLEEDSDRWRMCQKIRDKLFASMLERWEGTLESFTHFNTFVEREIMTTIEDVEKLQERQREKDRLLISTLGKKLKETEERYKLLVEEKARKDAEASS